MSAVSVPRVILKSRRERPFLGRHPWLFSGAIDRLEGDVRDGDEVAVCTHDGQFIAWGLFNSKSQIRVRLYSWEFEQRLAPEFWRDRLETAIRFRRGILKLDDPEGACRLAFSESDGLSGLVVDRYRDWLVVQLTSLAIARQQELIVKLLVELCQPRGIYLRTERGIGEAEGLMLRDGPLWGAVPDEPVEIVEHDLVFEAELRTGQKTGLYLDQRENRRAVRPLAAGRRVLDMFCYTGGFALSLARGGATEVLGIDVSNAAIEAARRNAERNGISNATFDTGDAFESLKRLATSGERFGMVVLDPPRFARSAGGVRQALRGYVRLNQMAVQVLEPDGILVTCSCSGLVSREDFVRVLAAVAEQTGRNIQILEQRGQAPDHPVSASCPETGYLKCFMCRVI